MYCASSRQPLGVSLFFLQSQNRCHTLYRFFTTTCLFVVQ